MSTAVISGTQGQRKSAGHRCREIPPEGEECDAGCWSRPMNWAGNGLLGFGYRGQRFLGNGLGSDTQGVRIDAYGSSGDYLGSGMDGLEIYVHGNAQDQLGQILKSGKLVVHAMWGQTFLYGPRVGRSMSWATPPDAR